jgi:hypothetical protein
MNNKSSPVPDEWWPQVNDFSRKMGYRFVLRKLDYPDRLKCGATLPLAMVWENRGVAPCYRSFALAFRLTPCKGGDAITAIDPVDIRTWLPGRFTFETNVSFASQIPHGRYRLSLGIVEPATQKPVVRLTIAGRDDDGWYPVGEVEVT